LWRANPFSPYAPLYWPPSLRTVTLAALCVHNSQRERLAKVRHLQRPASQGLQSYGAGRLGPSGSVRTRACQLLAAAPRLGSQTATGAGARSAARPPPVWCSTRACVLRSRRKAGFPGIGPQRAPARPRALCLQRECMMQSGHGSYTATFACHAVSQTQQAPAANAPMEPACRDQHRKEGSYTNTRGVAM